LTNPRESQLHPVDRGPETSGGTHHYFAAQPTAAHRPGLVRVVLPDLYLELETDSGMFSPGRLDPGTRFLLESELAPAAAGAAVTGRSRARWRPAPPARRSGRST
jgi:16S rRNA G1207 methylase RsmC